MLGGFRVFLENAWYRHEVELSRAELLRYPRSNEGVRRFLDLLWEKGKMSVPASVRPRSIDEFIDQDYPERWTIKAHITLEDMVTAGVLVRKTVEEYTHWFVGDVLLHPDQFPALYFDLASEKTVFKAINALDIYEEYWVKARRRTAHKTALGCTHPEKPYRIWITTTPAAKLSVVYTSDDRRAIAIRASSDKVSSREVSRLIEQVDAALLIVEELQANLVEQHIRMTGEKPSKLDGFASIHNGSIEHIAAQVSGEATLQYVLNKAENPNPYTSIRYELELRPPVTFNDVNYIAIEVEKRNGLPFQTKFLEKGAHGTISFSTSMPHIQEPGSWIPILVRTEFPLIAYVAPGLEMRRGKTPEIEFLESIAGAPQDLLEAVASIIGAYIMSYGRTTLLDALTGWLIWISKLRRHPVPRHLFGDSKKFMQLARSGELRVETRGKRTTVLYRDTPLSRLFGKGVWSVMRNKIIELIYAYKEIPRLRARISLTT